MFTTPEQVKAATGYDVTGDVIYMAQFIIEAFVGRTEADITNPHDRSVMTRAVTFQAAYMKNNFDPVYEQVALLQKATSDSSITMDTGLFAPYLAPLAALALNRLSTYRSRTVKTGAIYGKSPVVPWEAD